MKPVYRTLFFLLFALWSSTLITANTEQHFYSIANHSYKDDFDSLMEKIREDFNRNPPIDAFLKKFEDSKGCFTDIDYSRQDRTNWEPLNHIERLLNFAFAYTNPQNVYYQHEAIYNKIVKGLEYWYEYNPHCNNWWYNQIAEPQKIGILLIQMRIGKKRLPAVLENNTLQRMRQEGGHPAKWTGANRTDIALHWIYRACLEKNETDLKVALENAYSPIEYTVKEGFQHDNSYFQHGQQLYIGGYGDEILKGVTQIAMYTQKTNYALNQAKVQLLSKFMRETYFQTIRGQHMLFDVLGRGVSRKDITDKSVTALFAKRMSVLDPDHADEYNAIIARLEQKQPANYKLKPLHTHYFRGDYTLHVRPSYTFDVRMVSNRTMRCEYGNGENLKTYFMSDGCTNIVTNGNEYSNIFPVWNWAQIPGTTAPQTDTIPMAASDWQTRGTSTFAGGVSDSIYGASAYAYADTYAGINTEAKKAWFFFDNEVVCLGAGISSTSRFEVYTTVNQCLLLNKEIMLSTKNKKAASPKGLSFYENPEWILHNNIGYIFPKGGTIYLKNETQTGSWFDINHTESKEIQREEVVTLGFNHGTKPHNNTYAYIVVPNMKSAKELKAYNKNKAVEILANTDSMQVVKHNKRGIYQLIFYKKGVFNHKGMTIEVDKPCALMIKNIHQPSAELHIADPAQTQSKIKVNIYTPSSSGKAKTILANFEQSGVRAGATKSFRLNTVVSANP